MLHSEVIIIILKTKSLLTHWVSGKPKDKNQISFLPNVQIKLLPLLKLDGNLTHFILGAVLTPPFLHPHLH